MTAAVCPVCSEPVSEPNMATCRVCSSDFHLQMRTDIEGKDCGAVWINQEWLYLEFACQRCLDAMASGETPAPPVSRPARHRASARRRYRRRS